MEQRKKKGMQEMKLEWATAHFGVGSRYNVLYRDKQGMGGSTGARNRRVRARSGTPRHDIAGAATRCPGALRYG